MTLRTCNGNPGGGTTVSGAACTCGTTFDDIAQYIVYPHSQVTASGTVATAPAFYYTPGYYNPGAAWMQSSLFASGGIVSSPNSETFQNVDLAALAAAYSTIVKPGEKIVVCVDMDVNPQQIEELAERMTGNDINGIIIRGARAGTGAEPSAVFADPTENRLEILARIADCWEQRPDLTLAELLSWFTGWSGHKMSDEDFAVATEVHFKKVFGGIHGENK